ncbi:hypothetical protein BGZ61DRAFT_542268 [Ilyonectria robusta]|uniref:uncharacterized protein n=1 Tax=Ilyonectria robusta TaxID=1079257 RepID=UPI001E8D1A04|nr:uncharacterized protein BGZ61DRAFT_542268 [Ilyonectria robusta]KAH8649592.1 hypothetical protein BGZ61DRAFT_542268 [Ilyonectria robusta]
MSHITYVEIRRYLPQGVKRIIAHGGGCWIGEVDATTVLKYPHTRDEMRWIQIEAKILSVLGHHPRIVQSKGLTKDSLLLEFAPNGNLHDYLIAHPELADFQGQCFSANGDILLNALSVESTKAYLPRTPADYANMRTDLFALGSVIYFIIMGHEVFPWTSPKTKTKSSVDSAPAYFPLMHAYALLSPQKCWKQLYSSAPQVLADLEAVREAVARGETPDSVSDGHAPPPATSWLSGLCDDAQRLKVPPPYRQLVGFD